MAERFVMRHYGSCGHVVDEESKELFDKYAAPFVAHPPVGDPTPFQNEVTTETDGGVTTKVVHVHPFRYFNCKNCIEADLRAEGAWPHA